MAAQDRKQSESRRRTKLWANAGALKVAALLERDFRRSAKQFVQDLENYSWNLDELPFREMDNGKFFLGALQQLLDSDKTAIRKRFSEVWAICRSTPNTGPVDSVESSRKLIRETVARCWSLKAVLQEVPQFTVMEHVVPLYLPPGVPDAEQLCAQTDNDLLSQVDEIADSVAVGGIVSIDAEAMLGELASKLYDDLKTLQKFCGRSVPDEIKLRLRFPLAAWAAIDQSALTE